MVTDHALFGVHLGIALNYLGVLNRPERTLLENSWKLPENNGGGGFSPAVATESTRTLVIRNAQEAHEDGTHIAFDRVVETYVITVLKQVFERTQSDMRQQHGASASASARAKLLRIGEHSLGRACHYALTLYPINPMSRTGVVTTEFRRICLFVLENTREYDFVIQDAWQRKVSTSRLACVVEQWEPTREYV